MNQEVVSKCFEVENYLNKHDVFYTHNQNGHFVIEKASYWATKDKWYIPETMEKGYGLKTLLNKLNLL